VFDWGDLSNFEIIISILLVAIWGVGLAIYGRISYLVRLKEIELRKNGVID
jgi:hypothetical protein